MIPWNEITAARLERGHAVLAVHGEDARSWLSGQTTNDLAPLRAETPVYTLFANVKGRILADAWVLTDAAAERHWLVVPARSVAPLLESFEKYIIMEDVTVEATDLAVLTVRGTRAGAVVEAARGSLAEPRVAGGPAAWEGVEGMVLIVPRDAADGALRALTGAGAAALDDAAWQQDRIARGAPEFGTDFSDAHYPQEAGLKRAVSFSKGCYLGQEVICMLESRGQVTRRLCMLTVAGAGTTGGAELLTEDGRSVGQLTSVAPASGGAPARALGYVKRAMATPGTTLRVGGGAATASVERVIE